MSAIRIDLYYDKNNMLQLISLFEQELPIAAPMTNGLSLTNQLVHFITQ